jgi:glucose-1-phosphate cytidylyltransferase
MATVTGVQVRFQYGTLEADDHGQVAAYSQKPLLPNWINAGFMLFNHSVLELMRGDDIHLERQVLPALVEQGELMLYRHRGFWRSMDTLKDTVVLEQLWQESAPWKVW